MKAPADSSKRAVRRCGDLSTPVSEKAVPRPEGDPTENERAKDLNDFPTPPVLSRLMLEIVEIVPGKVLEPTPGPRNALVSAIIRRWPSCSVITPPGDFFAMPIEPVDLVVANPPFTPYQSV